MELENFLADLNLEDREAQVVIQEGPPDQWGATILDEASGENLLYAKGFSNMAELQRTLTALGFTNWEIVT